MDYTLKFNSEADAYSVLTSLNLINPATRVASILVTDPTLKSILDGLPLTDAYTVQLEGKTYKAEQGEWFEQNTCLVFTEVIAPYASIDVIGVIYKDAQPLDGFHINIRSSEEIPSLDQYMVYPSTPARVWA
jgi:hypothetical protein